MVSDKCCEVAGVDCCILTDSLCDTFIVGTACMRELMLHFDLLGSFISVSKIQMQDSTWACSDYYRP